ncbi:hypothetical protein PR048_005457 [Dryococelus australis]|uniref:Uncharacterized protein n=1 Tax=Dryococelus australis TaxID=614101 RepID=A0ABQ9I8D7_9NEOP|nr:hypothetical protein PR048_005457 [Dryococelus australis]
MDIAITVLLPHVCFQVQEFKSTGDKNKLFRDLDDVLDHNTEFYWQVRKLTYVLNLAMRMMGKRGYTQLASLLMCAGLPVDTADDDGETMLHGATREGQLEMVKLLLDHGADTSVKDSRGFTPLIRAANEGQLEAVKTLVEAGASTTARDIYGRTALERASESKVIQFLEKFPH